MDSKIKQVTEASFAEQVLESTTAVLVDYSAEWCGPCKMIAPALEASAVTNAGRLRVAKVDVDENQRLAARYHVRGIPTLMIFRGGKIVATKVGAVSKSQLAEFIESNIE